MTLRVMPDAHEKSRRQCITPSPACFYNSAVSLGSPRIEKLRESHSSRTGEENSLRPPHRRKTLAPRAQNQQAAWTSIGCSISKILRQELGFEIVHSCFERYECILECFTTTFWTCFNKLGEFFL
ncbi:hypothetical protein VN12_24310 [Pirellula sp. SH-Sr6A]|nr:hypothetical protein VN12_24310 [Pirellula sp. SH-Sr6A]